MSINHYYSSEIPEAQCQWWSPYIMESPAKTSSSSQKSHSHINSHLIPSHFSSTATATSFWPTAQLYHHHSAAASAMFCSQNTAFGFNLNNDDADEELPDDNNNNNSTTSSGKEVQRVPEMEEEIPKEPLFEKQLTPSDVGKLNRLVIPKQHAEKYFPLNGGDSGEKGFLLSFDDELGKTWRFRYSYWNSSQSYVLTKGWSRFVKEKRLEAGDIVVFTRHRVDGGRLFIGWRRRNSSSDGGAAANSNISSGGGGGWGRSVAYSSPRNNYQRGLYSSSPQPPYQPECVHAGSVLTQNHTVTASGNNNNSKRLRLFGVNLDFPADESEPSTPDDSPMSQPHSYLQQYYNSSHHNYMDINFSGGGDVYRQG